MPVLSHLYRLQQLGKISQSGHENRGLGLATTLIRTEVIDLGRLV